MSLLIKNGTIVNSDNKFISDVLCVDNKIVEIANCIELSDDDSEIIDASGCFVFPGGIDPHVHMNLPSKAGFSSDDFNSGSKAALWGGTTSIIDFVTPHRSQFLDEAIHQRLTEASNCNTSFSFHISPVKWHDDMDGQIKQCIDLGFTSFKVYTAYKDTIGISDDDLLKVMKSVGKHGGILLIHCELGDAIDSNKSELAKQGKFSPLYHPLSRPSYTESQSVKKAIGLAYEANCPIYIVHVSTQESLTQIRKSQKRGQFVYAETCPQYLIFDDSKYNGEFIDTASFVMSPPLRKKEDIDALWVALADGTIHTVGTDHCPFSSKQKAEGVDDFRKIPNGVGGVEHRLQLLYTYGVVSGKITINKFVELTSTNAARIFGLYPKKGIIDVGADADIVIWNPEEKSMISSTTHHQNTDINIYDGMEIVGSPEYVILDGKLIKEGNSFSNELSVGRLLKRK